MARRCSGIHARRQRNLLESKLLLLFPILIETEVGAVLDFFTRKTLADEQLLDVMSRIETRFDRLFERVGTKTQLHRAKEATGIVISDPVAPCYLAVLATVRIVEMALAVKAASRRRGIRTEAVNGVAERRHGPRPDENTANQKAALRPLEQLAYTADVVANGFEVTEAVEGIRYGGNETTSRIRRREDGANSYRRRGMDKSCASVVAMTADAMNDGRGRRHRAGMDDSVSKPVQIESQRTASEGSGDETSSASGERVPSRPEAKPVLNHDTLARLRELGRPGEPDILVELINMLLAKTPRQIVALRQVIAENDAMTRRRVAHMFKGSSGNLGADRLLAACSELEKLAKTGVVNGADKLLTTAEMEFNEAEEHLTAEKSK